MLVTVIISRTDFTSWWRSSKLQDFCIHITVMHNLKVTQKIDWKRKKNVEKVLSYKWYNHLKKAGLEGRLNNAPLWTNFISADSIFQGNSLKKGWTIYHWYPQKCSKLNNSNLEHILTVPAHKSNGPKGKHYF